MTKKSSEGRFFEKRARSSSGRFFENMPGREDGFFHRKHAEAMAQSATTDADKPAGGQEYRGEGMSGGMYGTGCGAKKKPIQKTSSAAPSDWESETLPNGAHRPTSEQPEDLEAGVERFHSSNSEGPSYSSAGRRGSMHVPAGSGHQVGKHASASPPPRFLGTPFAKNAGYSSEFKSSLSRAGSEFKGSLNEAKKQVEDEASGKLHSITKSPVAATALTALGGYLALRGGVRGAKALRGLSKKAPVKAAPKSLRDKARSGVQKLVSKITE